MRTRIMGAGKIMRAANETQPLQCRNCLCMQPYSPRDTGCLVSASLCAAMSTLVSLGEAQLIFIRLRIPTSFISVLQALQVRNSHEEASCSRS